MLLDDGYHLVDIEVDDEIGGQQVEALRDLVQLESGATGVDDETMIQPGVKHPLQVHHLGAGLGGDDVEIHREPGLHVGVFEQVGHDQFRVQAAGTRFQDYADLFVGLVADVGEKW